MEHTGNDEIGRSPAQQPQFDNDFDYGAEPLVAPEDVEEPRVAREPRKRAARKRNLRDDDEFDDDDYGKRKPRRKPARKVSICIYISLSFIVF